MGVSAFIQESPFIGIVKVILVTKTSSFNSCQIWGPLNISSLDLASDNWGN